MPDFKDQYAGGGRSNAAVAAFDYLQSIRAILSNQAPEPTTTAVTPLASSPVSEMNLPTQFPNAARGAPAVVVAHL